ncbi:hypothetical protein B0T18DRAFT_132137 [Schizothecium vesticola]|uniref:Uncharacterized protein n=1 Tax=Schizothecium vesticola TaxID=314040 RepID=A0AA40ETW7_9PEZI|nr:hypothetical protein B0T18DRAFT_132137 [Schizothecium vesticola]
MYLRLSGIHPNMTEVFNIASGCRTPSALRISRQKLQRPPTLGPRRSRLLKSRPCRGAPMASLTRRTQPQRSRPYCQL